jgi:penicillin-binding protein 1A
MPKRKFYRKSYKKRRAKTRGLGLLFKLFLFSSLFFIAAVTFVFLYFAKDFPRPELFAERQLAQSTKIYDRTGNTLLYEIYGEEKRTWMPLELIPEHMKQAVIATEDSNFYTHFGIDLGGIMRSIIADLKIGQPVYGGSTINQQLIRSTFLTLEKTAQRKIREIILSIELNRRYSKDKILEWYLNQVPFGQNAYGVEAAAQTYFKKSVSDIDVSEAAVLASLIRAPSYLSPYGENKQELLYRKDYVLRRMNDESFITNEQSEEYQGQEIIFSDTPVEIKAPYFTLWIKQQLEEKYGPEFLRTKGWNIYTSLDWTIQEIAEQTVKEGVERNRPHNANNAGLIAVNPKNGEILAMTVGIGDYYADSYPEGCISGVDCLFDPKFNVVIGTRNNPGRQPGSAFKPFVYATAFKKGFHDRFTVVDEPTNFGLWGDEEYEPQNYDGLFRGEVTLRESLAQSLNVPSVKVLLNLAGIDDSIKTAEDMGINTLNPPFGPSIVLGGWEVRLIEITSAYGVFANDGVGAQPISILKIEDSSGILIYENKKSPRRILESNVARLINDILSDNDARAPLFGYYSALYFENYDTAAKTGTTQDYRDAWTVGYAPSIVAGVWTGNNNNEPMAKKPGILLSSPIWRDFMEKVIVKFPKEDFIEPDIDYPEEYQATTTNDIIING